jgi:hypothetical protein
MPHHDLTAHQALDAIAASARELAKAHKSLTEFVHGPEATRVARVLEFEVAEMNANVSLLRKALGDQKAEERAEQRSAALLGTPMPTPVGASDG